MSDSERIKAIEKKYGLSPAALARTLGLKSAQTFYDIHKGKHGISNEVATKILEIFKDIREEWIRTGEGEMLKSDKNATAQSELDFSAMIESTAKIADAVQTIARANEKMADTNGKMYDDNRSLMIKMFEMLERVERKLNEEVGVADVRGVALKGAQG